MQAGIHNDVKESDIGMGRLMFISIFVSSFISGLFPSLGTNPVPNALSQVIDSVCSSEQNLACFILKIFIYAVFVILPLIVDIAMILVSGKMGIVSAIFGFSAGFTVIHNSVIGTLLLIVGAVFSIFVKPTETYF